MHQKAPQHQPAQQHQLALQRMHQKAPTSSRPTTSDTSAQALASTWIPAGASMLPPLQCKLFLQPQLYKDQNRMLPTAVVAKSSKFYFYL